MCGGGDAGAGGGGGVKYVIGGYYLWDVEIQVEYYQLRRCL